MRGQGDPVVHVGEEAAGRPRWQASGDGTKRESGDETESGRGMRHHGTSQPTQRCKVVGEHASILVAQGGDVGPARRRQFGQRSHACGAEERNWGVKRELTGGPRLSVVAAR
jgi:hypothetical protein